MPFFSLHFCTDFKERKEEERGKEARTKKKSRIYNYCVSYARTSGKSDQKNATAKQPENDVFGYLNIV